MVGNVENSLCDNFYIDTKKLHTWQDYFDKSNSNKRIKLYFNQGILLSIRLIWEKPTNLNCHSFGLPQFIVKALLFPSIFFFNLFFIIFYPKLNKDKI